MLVSPLVPDLSPMPTGDPTLESLCSATKDLDEVSYLREERAGIFEFLAGFSRPEAERRALAYHTTRS